MDVKTWQQVSEAGAVVFSDVVKHHRPGGHVHPHRKRFCGEQHLGKERFRCFNTSFFYLFNLNHRRRFFCSDSPSRDLGRKASR